LRRELYLVSESVMQRLECRSIAPCSKGSNDEG
jgi:hypothetical protein